jgi:hypothetical protein
VLDRFPRFFGRSPADSAACLREVALLLVGIGSVGSRMACDFARLGVGTLWLVDPGEWAPENLFTSPIDPSAIGRGKARHIGQLCGQISPSSRIFTTRSFAQDLDPADFAEVAMVLIATDNLAAELSVAESCLRVATPIVHAAVSGDDLVAQVRCCSSVGQCLACGFGSHEWSLATASTVFSCSGDHGRESLALGPPTRSISALCAIASGQAVSVALRHLLSLGPPVIDRECEYAGYLHRATSSRLGPNPRCRLAPHTSWRIHRVSHGLAALSLGDLARVAGLGYVSPLTFTLPGRQWVARLRCGQCGLDLPGRFVRLAAPTCDRCAQPLIVDPIASYAAVGSDQVSLDVPLGALGVPSGRSVIVHSETADSVLVIGASP